MSLFPKAMSLFPKAMSLFPKTMSLFPKTMSLFPKTMSLFPKTMSLLKNSSFVAIAIAALQRATFRPITVFINVFKTVFINNTMIARKISIISILSIYIILGRIILSVTLNLKLERGAVFLKIFKTLSLFCDPVFVDENFVKVSQVKIRTAI